METILSWRCYDGFASTLPPRDTLVIVGREYKGTGLRAERVAVRVAGKEWSTGVSSVKIRVGDWWTPAEMRGE